MTLALALPLSDWQFWVVSGICAFAACWLLRDVLPIPALKRMRRRKRSERRARLTISAKSTEKEEGVKVSR